MYECEKKSWTIYIILFNLKVLSSVLSLCQKAIDNPNLKEKRKFAVEKNILVSELHLPLRR